MRQFNVLITFCMVVVLAACNHEEALSPQQTLLLQQEVVEGDETYHYEYSEGKLQKFIAQFHLFDPFSQSPFIDTVEFFFEYSPDDRVRKITGHNQEFYFTFEANDLLITEISLLDGDTSSQIRFKNFEALNVSEIEFKSTYCEQVQSIFPAMDAAGNIISSDNEDSIDLQDSYECLGGRVFSFLGEMEFDNKQNIYANFNPEIRLWLTWNKNPNNMTRRAVLDEIWEFEYEYNNAGFPTTRKSIRHNTTSGATYNPVIRTYSYILQ
ncbi:MAG: hypothetical protein HUU01_22330 [Saprospiraceae bacterium]|nr:hypothetical protein [Saprospiraceae bacterium]